MSPRQVPISLKFRPKKFAEVIGHEAHVSILSNSLRSLRLPKGVLFTGGTGLGKTTLARIFAKALLCEHLEEGFEPCCVCQNCQLALQGAHPDIVEMDAASRSGVDHIREMIDSAAFLPLLAKRKVYVIDEVHMLSMAAFNALLKTLEEPPSHVHFCFATTEARKVPCTIAARCITLNLGNLTSLQLSENLRFISSSLGTKVEQAALEMISEAAQGSVRNSVSLLEKCSIFSGIDSVVTAESARKVLGYPESQIIEGILAATQNGNLLELLKLSDIIYEQNVHIDSLFSSILSRVVDLMVAKVTDQAHISPYTYSRGELNALWENYFKSQEMLLSGVYPNHKNLLKIALMRGCSALEEKGGPIVLTEGSALNSSATPKTRHYLQDPIRVRQLESNTESPTTSEVTDPTSSTNKGFENLMDYLQANNELNLYSFLKSHPKYLDFTAKNIVATSSLPQKYIKILLQILRDTDSPSWTINRFGRTDSQDEDDSRTQKFAESAHEEFCKTELFTSLSKTFHVTKESVKIID